MLRRVMIQFAGCLTATLSLGLQAQQHTGMPAMDHAALAAPSAAAQRQIASVAQAVKPLGAPDAAQSAGYRSFFGWIPTMGVHWVDTLRMEKSQQSSLTSPNNLMFSRIAGRDSLVGAAYAFYAPVSDTLRPSLFDGAPAWHEHQDLAPAGQTLVMLHVWFVPSPDGPFANTNPNLPFWAAGLEAPDATRMKDATFKAVARRASLALADVTDTLSVFPAQARRPDVQAALLPHRDSVRAIVRGLAAAQKAQDAQRVNGLIERAAAQWDTIYAVYLGLARTPAVRQRMEQRAVMLLGEHVH